MAIDVFKATSAGELQANTAAKALVRAALFSVVLALVKLTAFLMSGSVLVLASLFDSIGDAVVSYLNSLLQRLAKNGPDREHPFGHGGIEVVSSLIQGIVLAVLALALVWKSLAGIQGKGAELLQQESVLWSVVVLLGSAGAGFLVQLYLHRKVGEVKANDERSLVLLSDQSHYAGDVWLNLFSALGLVVVWLTGESRVDAVLGLVSSGFLFRAAYPVWRHTIRDILSNEVDPELQQRIVDIALATDARVKSVHRLRSRELGPNLFVDFHMTLPSAMTLEAAHDVGEAVTAAICAQIPRADVLIHLDPDSEPDDDRWHPAYQSPSGTRQ